MDSSVSLQDAKSFIIHNGEMWVWKGDAMLTLRGDRMEQIREILKADGINVIIEADTIYRLLDRIYDLEKRVKKLET